MNKDFLIVLITNYNKNTNYPGSYVNL